MEEEKKRNKFIEKSHKINIHTAANICCLLSPIGLDATLLVVEFFAIMDDVVAVVERMLGATAVVNGVGFDCFVHKSL